MIIKNYFEDLKVLHLNTMPNRAYYVPVSEGSAPAALREDSDRLMMLDGQWDFRYYDNVREMEDEFWTKGFCRCDFEKIPVPSVWQNHGHDRHHYTNTRYPFPFDPPFVPLENPCGAYIRDFTLAKKDGSRYYLNFEGVDSCFYLWINGEFAGYSQVSHSTSEFDATPLLNDGGNTIAVLVVKWCDGSYMEAQDKLRMSGIFRDVYLLTRSENHLRDFTITTPLSDNCSAAEILVSTEFLSQTEPVSYLLSDSSGAVLQSGTSTDGKIAIPVSSPILWNAENPYLYTLSLTACGETIYQKVGLRDIRVEGCIVYLNGQKIKFRGANRHDSDPVAGFAVTREMMKQDLRLMKEHNINAVRTSHYPNSPIFTEMCDEYGFYVIDEADNECHGVCDIYSDEEYTDRWAVLADNPDWQETIVDRVQRGVIRDKNRTSVVIWSMGNESGFGCCFEAALAWTKEYDPTRLTHYEGAMHYDPDILKKYQGVVKNPDFSNIDLYSMMYPSIETIHTYFTRNPVKPFILCEYIHAMGNGPGDAEDYQQLIEQYEGFCGGFVWEWCDHSVYMGKTNEGKSKYYYGGDFGEFPHDGNFCMDGLVYPDRTPHTGLKEFQNVIRPLRITAGDLEKREFIFRNILDFTNLSDLLEVSYTLTCDGEAVSEGTVCGSQLDIPPHSSKAVPLAYDLPDKGTVCLDFTLHQTAQCSMTAPGHILGTDQVILRESRDHARLDQLLSADVKTGALSYCENDRRMVVKGSHFRYVYSKDTGVFEEMVYDNHTLLQKPMEYNLWRAPTDNDRNIRHQWEAAGFDRILSRAYTTEASMDNGKLLIKSTASLSAIVLQRMAEMEIVWTVAPDGTLDVDMQVKKDPRAPFFPRFGLRLFLSEGMDSAEYFGYGPYESYADKHRASHLGRFCSSVEDLHEDYIKPQENGSHWNCRYLSLSGGCTALTVSGQPFSFNASHYTQEELTRKTHNFELEKSGYTVLCLDTQMSGVGSNSCGPELLEQYRLNAEQFELHMSLKPATK